MTSGGVRTRDPGRRQPAPLGQGNDRYQSRRRHEIRVIEHRASHRVGMRELHPRDALLAGVKTDLGQAQFSQPARAFRHSDALTTPTSSVDRGLGQVFTLQKAGQHVADNGRIISIGSSTTVLEPIGVGPPQARG